MAIDLVNLGDTLLTTMVEPDAAKRDSAIEAWLDSSVPVLQAALREQLGDYIRDTIKKGVSEQKARRYIFRLIMQFNLERVAEREKLQVPTPVAGSNPPPQKTVRDDGGEDSSDEDSSKAHSPNDDRSDSMNPNNPAYQAAMDNRSNQMNPNNPAYGSSRGGGRGR